MFCGGCGLEQPQLVRFAGSDANELVDSSVRHVADAEGFPESAVRGSHGRESCAAPRRRGRLRVHGLELLQVKDPIRVLFTGAKLGQKRMMARERNGWSCPCSLKLVLTGQTRTRETEAKEESDQWSGRRGGLRRWILSVPQTSKHTESRSWASSSEGSRCRKSRSRSLCTT